MPRFWVSGTGTVTFTMHVDAETVEDAKKQVKEKPLVDLPWDSEEIEINDADLVGKGG
jgi:hypothetical protein